MKKIKILGLALCLVLSLALSVSASTVEPTAIGNIVVGDLENPLLKADIWATHSAKGWDIFQQSWSQTGFIASISGHVDLDPAIFFSHSASNLGAAPLAITFNIGPFFGVGFAAPANLAASNGVSLTDSNANGLVSIAPNANPLIQTNFTETNTWGVNPGFAAGVVPGFTATSPAFAFVGVGPGTNFDFLETVSYILSPGDDLGMTGSCFYSAVPVPPSVLLLGSGLLVLLRRRRQQI